MAERDLTCRRCNKQFKHHAPNKLYCDKCCRAKKKAYTNDCEEKEDLSCRIFTLTGAELRDILSKLPKRELIGEVLKIRLILQNCSLRSTPSCALVPQPQEITAESATNAKLNFLAPQIQAAAFGLSSFYSNGSNDNPRHTPSSVTNNQEMTATTFTSPGFASKKEPEPSIWSFSFDTKISKGGTKEKSGEIASEHEEGHEGSEEESAESYDSVESDGWFAVPSPKVDNRPKIQHASTLPKANPTPQFGFENGTALEKNEERNDDLANTPFVSTSNEAISSTSVTLNKVSVIREEVTHKEQGRRNKALETRVNDSAQNSALPVKWMLTFKICIIGDGAVGKTTFIGRLHNGSFEKKYIPTIGVDMKPLQFETNAGPVIVNIWDIAGQEKFSLLRTGYYTETDAFIIMFDVTSRMTYKNVPNWYAEAMKKNPGAPSILLGNKVDLVGRQVKPRTITFHRTKNIQYNELSVKSNYNVDKPFLYLLRRLTHNNDLTIVSGPLQLQFGNIARIENIEAENKNDELSSDDELVPSDALHTSNERSATNFALVNRYPNSVSNQLIDEVAMQNELQNDDEVDFRPLTSEDEELVGLVLNGRDLDIVAAECNLELERRDLRRLHQTQWLNDEVVNFYMNVVLAKRCRELGSKCHFFNSFFYPLLSSSGGYNYARVQKWTNAIDIFVLDKVLVPIHLGNHWCLAVINLLDKRFEYYDSLGGENKKCLERLERYVKDEYKMKHDGEFDTSDWKFHTPLDIPHQQHGYDCGVFMCKFADYSSKNKPFNFSQNHMQYFRKQMILEIIKKPNA